MAGKRKADVLDAPEIAVLADSPANNTVEEALAPVFVPPTKKTRTTKAKEVAKAKEAAADASATKAKKGKAKEDEEKPASWQDVVLERGEDGVPVYDDCNEIRRKIRTLQKTPGFKVTQWLRDIGNVNSNSFGRFMKATGPTGGPENSTYYCAYVYFEKVRIAEGKKKTKKRLDNEVEWSGGMPLQDNNRRGMWIIAAKPRGRR